MRPLTIYSTAGGSSTNGENVATNGWLMEGIPLILTSHLTNWFFNAVSDLPATL